MIDLPTLFQDQHLLAIAKPAGILSVPPSGAGERNIADHLRRKAEHKGGMIWPVHRLDKDTSGVLLFARTEDARRALDRAFRMREVEKIYLALVHGRPRPAEGTVRSFIADRGQHASSSATKLPGARAALTHYRILEQFDQAALVEARPETGRFNQIRLHMQDLGCPIVGDRKYGVGSRHALKGPRVLLHASRLCLRHPISGKALRIDAELTEDFVAVLSRLRGE